MNEGTLVRKNLTRRTLRTILLIVSILIAFFIFGVLGSFNYAFNYAENPSSANRLITINKINFTQPLPHAYLGRIRRAEGVVAAAPMVWFGGYYREPQDQIQSFPTEPQALFDVYGEDIVLPPDQKEAFLRDRTGIIIGRSIANRYGIRLGQRLPLHTDIYTNRSTGRQVWDFTVVGIFDAGRPQDPTSAAYFNLEYFRESVTFGPDFIGWVAMKTVSTDQNDAIARRIDRTFANSPAETRTQDETAFGRAFLAQLGNIAFIITLVVSAAFLAILMVVGNTMMMAVRERTKEIGVLKTLGFTSGRIVRMILSESLLLCLIGAAIGLGLAALTLAGVSAAVKDFMGSVDMPVWVALIGLGFALAFGLIVGAAPALSAFNLKIVDALGRK